MQLSKTIATFFGVGYIGKGGGTVAAFLTCLLLYLGVHFHFHPGLPLLLVSCLLMAVGIGVSSVVEKSWGKDNKRVVIDEVLGMAVSVVFLPINFTVLLTGFGLFRYFDIAKPLGIRRTEALPGGWGVMTDDLLAGIYSNIALRFILYILNP